MRGNGRVQLDLRHGPKWLSSYYPGKLVDWLFVGRCVTSCATWCATRGRAASEPLGTHLQLQRGRRVRSIAAAGRLPAAEHRRRGRCERRERQHHASRRRGLQLQQRHRLASSDGCIDVRIDGAIARKLAKCLF